MHVLINYSLKTNSIMQLTDLKTKETPKPVSLYNYHRLGEHFTTPNAEIAIARRADDSPIQVETHIGSKVEHSVLVLEQAD